MWRTPATLAGLARATCPTPGRSPPMTILALETSCDDTCAAVLDGDGRDPLERDLLAGGARALRRRRAGDRLAPPPRADQRRRRARRWRGAGSDARARSSSSPPRRARACRRAARRPVHGEGARGRARAAVRAGRSPPGARRRELPARRRDAGERRVRAAVRVPDRQRRAHAARARRASTTASRCSGARSTTPPARRSTRARGCSASAIPGGAALERLAADGDPEAFSFPGSPGERARGGRARAATAFARGPRLLLRGPQDGAAVRAARALRARTRARARADLAASYQAAIVESLVGARRAGARAHRARAPGGRRRRRGQRRAAPAPAASWASTLHVPERALCTDNAAMIASAARYARAARLPALPRRSTRTRPASARA